MAIRVAAVVVAAGRGTRAGLDFPKQYKVLGGTPMVRESLRVFTEHPEVDLVLPVIHPDDTARFAAAAEGSISRQPVAGCGNASGVGAGRAGGARAKPRPTIVLVHDAARPFTSQALVSRAIAAARAKRRRRSGTAGDRYGEAGRRARAASPRRSTARRCAPCRRRRPSPTLPCSTRIGAPPRRPRGFSRRCRAGRMGGLAGHGIRG